MHEEHNMYRHVLLSFEMVVNVSDGQSGRALGLYS